MRLSSILLLSFVLVVVVRCQDLDLYELPAPPLPDDDTSPDVEDGDDGSSSVIDDTNSGLVKRAADDDYSDALKASILFFEAQRSGDLPDDNRIPWRKPDSAMNDKGFAPGCPEEGDDLSGGMYDAGDHVKFNLPMAWSTTMLAWSMLVFKDAYTSISEVENNRALLKWNCDYFIKCHPRSDVYYYQVGSPGLDHSIWDRPENMTMNRPAYWIGPGGASVGADVAAETAAALAGCAKVFKSVNSKYHYKCLAKSKSLLEFAESHKGTYPPQMYYKSTKFWDEIAWASIWLYWATNQEKYWRMAKQTYNNKKLKGKSYAFGWSDKREGVKLLMGKLTPESNLQRDYYSAFKSYMNGWCPGGAIPYTPKGLVCRTEWGSLRWAADTAALAIIAAKYGVRANPYRAFAKAQTDYILGFKGSSHSFVVGFGKDPPEKPHHRSSSCPDMDERCTNKNSFKYIGANHHSLIGAMVGGPNCADNWSDNRNDYVKNEVACDYNAGFQTLISGIVSQELAGLI